MLCVQSKLLSFQQQHVPIPSGAHCYETNTCPSRPPPISALLLGSIAYVALLRTHIHIHIPIHIHTHREHAPRERTHGTATCTVKWQISKRKVRAPATVTLTAMLYIGVPFRSTHAVMMWMYAFLPLFLSCSRSYNSYLTRR